VRDARWVAKSTNPERVLEALRLSSLPLDDDQLSERSGVRPRQAVNQICRALEQAGVVRRYQGDGGKIVNRLQRRASDEPSPYPAPSTADAVRSAAPAEPVLAPMGPGAVPPGSSLEQREAERLMLDLLGTELGVVLDPARVGFPSGVRVEIDGADSERTVLVECWAHQGKPKAAQRHKVLADAFKLNWIDSTMYPKPRLILCMSDPAAAEPFLPTSRSWAARALQDLAISISIVNLPDHVRQRVQAAQQRQYR
jgi:hypothetical protein